MTVTSRRFAGPSARRSALAVLVLVMLVAVGVAPAGACTPGPVLRLGTLRLGPCGRQPESWCGSARVPLDRGTPGSPALGIGFEWVPATGRPEGTTVVVDGGPGWATTYSRTAYLELLGPLRAHRNLLMVDLRGTGHSEVLRCAELENYKGRPSGPDFARTVGACGDRLDHTWQRPDGGWIHASESFGTADAAQDLADLLPQLGLNSVDLYGDSYGSWFAQVFATRHPSLLRSLTLDATYEVFGLDPWYTSSITTARKAFGLACRRSPACAAHGSADAWRTVSALAARLRATPLTGTTTGLDGQPATVTVTVTTLVDLVTAAGSDPAVYHGLQAAAEAFLGRGDTVPLLRLAEQTIAYDGTNAPPPAFSDTLYFATACTDYPQLFSMAGPVGERARRLRSRIAAEPDAAFAPFTAAEWTTADAYTNTYDACLDWPVPQRARTPVTARPPRVPPTLPVLVLGGDLDSLTPAAGGRHVAAQLGPSARFVTVPNLTHITAMADRTRPGPEACGQSLYRQFLGAPTALSRLNTSCTRHTPAIPVLAAYPARLADTVPATPAPGNQADAGALRAAASGVAVVGDAIVRSGYLSEGHDTGLRGGSWTVTGDTQACFGFTGVRWADDAAVSGTATWDRVRGVVTAHLLVTPDTGRDSSVDTTWTTLAPDVPASVTGTAEGVPLRGTLPAPA
ncbi:alpha/beta hydrolase [Streptomyces sp. ET3-23]|uniref:alpha/beta hydrolase n=1 Tax=Streptomyces sp. ET3-23 TaxID=2885643 RepID=UPI001D124381|nr:alpha/beta hydrolase [Streptomyces sp. ET3-23]MCC2280119.1 alpha/beta hydrolase [Streptomyces sp. ET3-23]